MALGVTGDNNAYALLKEYYGEQKLEALVFRNDPDNNKNILTIKYNL